MGIVNALTFHAADRSNFLHEATCNTSRADNAYTLDTALLFPEHGAGDIFGALQIDHLAIVFEIVKLTTPIRANSEDINAVFFDV